MEQDERVNNVQTAGATRSKDPVCGMMVDPATARGGSYVHKASTYFFCNPRCRERFAADPEKYLDPAYKPGGMGGMVQLGGTSPQQMQPPGTPIAPSLLLLHPPRAMHFKLLMQPGVKIRCAG